MKLTTGDDIAILTLGGNDYVEIVNKPESPYMLFPGGNTVTPGVELWTCTADDSVNIDSSKYIRDNSNRVYNKIVGGRPRNIVRR